MIKRGLEKLTEVSDCVDMSVDKFLEGIVGIGLFAEAKDARDAAINFLATWLKKPVELVGMLKEGKMYGVFRVNGDAFQMGPYDLDVIKYEDHLALCRKFFKKDPMRYYE